MTSRSVAKSVDQLLKALKEVQIAFGPVNKHSKNVADLIQSGGRRTPIVETIGSESLEANVSRQMVSDAVIGAKCVVTPDGGYMCTDYFPMNKELSQRIEKEFKLYESARSPISETLQEARNFMRLLNVLDQHSDELESSVSAVEDRMEAPCEGVSAYVNFIKEVWDCHHRRLSHPAAQIRRRDLLLRLEELEERQFFLQPVELPDLGLRGDIFNDFEDYLSDETPTQAISDISLPEFFRLLPPLEQLDQNKLKIVKDEIKFLISNTFFDTDVREAARKIEDRLIEEMTPERLSQVDADIRRLGAAISLSS